MVTSTSLPVRLVKLVRDYGAVIALAGLVLLWFHSGPIWVLVAFTVVNGGFLAGQHRLHRPHRPAPLTKQGPLVIAFLTGRAPC